MSMSVATRTDIRPFRSDVSDDQLADAGRRSSLNDTR